MDITNKCGTAPKRTTKVGIPSEVLGQKSHNTSYSPTWYQNPDVAGYSDVIKPVNVKNKIANHYETANDPTSRYATKNKRAEVEADKRTIRATEVW